MNNLVCVHSKIHSYTCKLKSFCVIWEEHRQKTLYSDSLRLTHSLIIFHFIPLFLGLLIFNLGI